MLRERVYDYWSFIDIIHASLQVPDEIHQFFLRGEDFYSKATILSSILGCDDQILFESYWTEYPQIS